MGRVKKKLAEVVLPDRDAHNGRCFTDLAENVHIHYREHRLIFSVEEFFVIAKAFEEGAKKLEEAVKNGYKEWSGKQPEIIGGQQKVDMPIEDPTRSYYNNRMVIEQQESNVIDDIHIHYRDYRLVMDNHETFKKFCECVKEAEKNLEPKSPKSKSSSRTILAGELTPDSLAALSKIM